MNEVDPTPFLKLNNTVVRFIIYLITKFINLKQTMNVLDTLGLYRDRI